MFESCSAWLDKRLPGFTRRDRRSPLRAATPAWTKWVVGTREISAELSGDGKFRLVVSGIEDPPKGAGILVSVGGKEYRLLLEVTDSYLWEHHGTLYELTAVLDSGLEGVKDISEVELKFLPLL